MANEYALYKGEKILAIGTIEEIAKQTNVKRETVLYYGQPVYKRRTTEKARRLVKLD